MTEQPEQHALIAQEGRGIARDREGFVEVVPRGQRRRKNAEREAAHFGMKGIGEPCCQAPPHRGGAVVVAHFHRELDRVGGNDEG